MTNGERENWIIGRWQMGHPIAGIRQQLLMLERDHSDHYIMSVIRRYIDDASENAKINRNRLWLLRLRRALRRLQ